MVVGLFLRVVGWVLYLLFVLGVFFFNMSLNQSVIAIYELVIIFTASGIEN